MSWAAKVKAAQDKKAPEQDLKKVTINAPVDGGKNLPALDDLAQGEVNSVTLPTFNKGLCVLDANAFIKGMDNLVDLADALITIPQVVREVKDAKARELLEALPLPLTQLDPTTESMKEVMDMSKKTGDFGVLSRTDIRIAALALDAAKQTNNRKECIVPRPAVLNPVNYEVSGVTVIDDEYQQDIPEDDEEDEEEEEVVSEFSDEETEGTAAAADGSNQQLPPGMVDEDDGCGTWITPENIKATQAKDSNGLCTAFTGGVACITSDFPIQNVLLHLGVSVVGPTGLQIRQLRTWLLRCHACYTLVHDTTRTFCPACGSGNTLKRVSYEVDEEGNKRLFVNFNKKISTRGTVYALPKPRGGKRGTNKTLALREDQLAHITHPHRKLGKEKNVTQNDEYAVFGESDRTKKFDPNKPREASSYRRYNPNERKKQLAGRRK